MHATLKRRIALLESTATASQEQPRWLAKANKYPDACRFLWLVASGADGCESARQRLHDRFGEDAAAMLAEYAADRRRVLELDDC